MMNNELLDVLLERFIQDSEGYQDLEVPPDISSRRRALRSLMNIRMPRPVSQETLSLQDQYLQIRAKEKGIVTLADLPEDRDGITLWQGDITRLQADAIVNSQMLGCFAPCHGCIDNCLHTYAGVQMRLECAGQMEILRRKNGAGYEQPTAVPMLTDGYNLPARKVVHIVGPIVDGPLMDRHRLELAACYVNTLNLCAENGLRNVAFCCISTGVFSFPQQEAAGIAVQTVRAWLKAHPDQIDLVIFNVFTDKDDLIYRELLGIQ